MPPDSFTPKLLRDYLLLYLEPNIGSITYSNGLTDVAITVGNSQDNNATIHGIEINIPLFPDSEEVSLVDRDTATYVNLWELHLFLWDDTDDGRLKLYEMLSVMVRMLSNVRIFCCPGGIARGFNYSEHYCVTFRQTCTGAKWKLS